MTSTDLEIGILQEATKSTLAYARWLMVTLWLLFALGLFHTFVWYASWDHARIEGRRVLLRAEHSVIDDQTRQRYARELVDLEQARSGRRVSLPLIGVDVSMSDFPLGLMTLGLSLQVLLLVVEFRLSAFFRRLLSLQGWGPILSLLRYQFVVHESSQEKLARWAILSYFLVPVMGACFFLSDILDAVFLKNRESVGSILFGDRAFLRYVWLRLGLDVVFMLAGLWLGVRTERVYRSLERDLLKGAR